MIQKIKNRLAIISSLIALGFPIAAPAMAFAAAPDIQGNLCQGANLQVNGNNQNCATGADRSTLQSKLATIINLLSILIGVVAVIMIIYGGFRYITSGGDATRVGNAKNTILYAIIGLIIVALAQVIVKFVLNTASQ